MVGACAAALSLCGVACSASPQRLTKPEDAAKRLATELGTQLDRNGLAPMLASSQNVLQPWYAWNASTGQTSLKTLTGDEMDVSMSFWSGTLWSTLRGAATGDGYCLLVSPGVELHPGQPIAWWVKPSGSSKGKLTDAAGCASFTTT